MTVEAHVLGDDAVRATVQGYEVDLGLAWYRSLPLSCVEEVSVTVAGRTARRSDVRVLRNGIELTLDELADRVNDEWFVQDLLTVVIPDPSPLAKGTEAEVGLTLAMRIPYIILAPQTALVKSTHVNRSVVIQ